MREVTIDTMRAVLEGAGYRNLDQITSVEHGRALGEMAAARTEAALETLDTAVAVVETLKAKLAKALDALKKAQTYITDLEEQEGAEGFSQSTGGFGQEYYISLAELEKKAYWRQKND